jgi:hypothetical protein
MAKKKSPKKKPSRSGRTARGKYPRHAVEAALRIPALILDQGAGKPCTDKEAASFAGLGSPVGVFAVEISSGIKYGFLERPDKGKLAITTLARKALRPQGNRMFEGVLAQCLRST